MSLADWRDLFIIIFSIMGILATLFFLLLALVVFSKVASILNSAQKVMDNMKTASAFVSDAAVKPVVRIMGFVSGVGKALGFLAKLSGEQEEGKRGKR